MFQASRGNLGQLLTQLNGINISLPIEVGYVVDLIEGGRYGRINLLDVVPQITTDQLGGQVNKFLAFRIYQIDAMTFFENPGYFLPGRPPGMNLMFLIGPD
jgi:hypothetical protein